MHPPAQRQLSFTFAPCRTFAGDFFTSALFFSIGSPRLGFSHLPNLALGRWRTTLTFNYLRDIAADTVPPVLLIPLISKIYTM